MNPLSLNPGVLLASLIVAAAAGAGAAWTAQEWRMDAAIADLKREHAAEKADNATAALGQIQTDIGRMRTAAETVQAGAETFQTAAATLQKGFKRENPPPPLPADCRLDSGRLRYLEAVASAANDSIPRLSLSTTLQGDPRP